MCVCVCVCGVKVLTFHGADPEEGDKVGVLKVGELVNLIVHQPQLVFCGGFCSHTEGEGEGEGEEKAVSTYF